ncbi:DUF4112 domain-containing protein [Aquibium carbonis]|uniref:DUF4112 domain-containing protein n=1 Tax=Aquibium carbonis TaxID=2495581 RepID=A0A3S0A7S3_9HYPH|nr:DUF4112 domain-containing protein [Aquibium carbonis]RST85765.1 DUF4112 domain-containing protein [Aquibium carbonis]
MTAASARPGARATAFEDIEALARNLDSRWRIPGTSIRFGLDAIAGLIPGAGDLAAALVAGHIIIYGWRAGAPGHVIARMIANVAIDTVFGSVPVLGSVFDVYYKANNRNVRLLRRHFERASR